MAKAGKSKTEQRTPLNRDRVAQAALALADAQGVQALTMRKLAEALGVEAMSLYHHVKNKDDLLDVMVDAVFAEIELPKVEGDWKAAMRARAESAHEVLVRHPWAIGLMDSRKNAGPPTLRHHDRVLGSLRYGGFSVAMAAHAFSLLDAYIYGFTIQEVALPFTSPEELEAIAEPMLAHLASLNLPHLAELTREHALKPGYRYSDEFGYGLDLVLDALEQAVAKAQAAGL